MPGGILWHADWDRLVESINLAIDRFPGERLRFLEIGVADGRTSCDLIAHILARTGDYGLFQYHGIDPAPSPMRCLGLPYSHHRGLSRDFLFFGHKNDPVGFHWVLIDGCHCAQCVAFDAEKYGRLLVPGGIMAFHDASPGTQGLDPQTYHELDGIHDRDEAAKGIAVRKALDERLPPFLRLLSPAPAQDRGGVEIYERI